MKITAVKPFVLDAGVYVKVETDEGLYGIGEAGIKRRGRAIAEVVHSLAPDLVGADPFRIEHLWQVMFRGGFFPGGGIQTSAVSAVDIALWDIKGKALGVPVYELLGGRVRDRVACYPHNGDPRNIESLVASCEKTRQAGFKFARWGIADASLYNMWAWTAAAQARERGAPPPQQLRKLPAEFQRAFPKAFARCCTCNPSHIPGKRYWPPPCADFNQLFSPCMLKAVGSAELARFASSLGLFGSWFQRHP